MFRTLVSPRLLALKNSLTLRTTVKKAPFVAVGIVFWILLYVGSCRGLEYMRGMEIIGDVLAERLFSMIFFSLAGFLVLSNVITALSSFYLSRDLAFLFSKPVRTADILRLKTFEAILNSSWMVIVFIPPVFIAYGRVFDASTLYYPVLAAALMAFILIAAGVGASGAHLLTRVFPAGRSRAVLLGLGLLLFLLVYAVVKTSVPAGSGSPGDVISALLRFNTDSPFLPGYWVTECLFPLLRGQGMNYFYAGLLLSNAAFFLLLSLFIGGALYKKNMELIRPSASRPAKWSAGDSILGRLPAVPLKDVKVFSRDTGQWSQVFIILALVFVYVYNFRAVPIQAMAGLTPFIREIMVFLNMALAGLVLSAVAARFLYTSVSLEGQAFWLIRAAPVDLGRFLKEKCLFGCITLTLMISLLVFLTNSALGVKGPLMAASLVTMIMLSVSISGLGTGLGAAYPKFRYENIASVSMSLGAMAFMLTAFSLVLVTLLLGSRAYYLLFMRPAPTIEAGAIAEIVVCVFLMLALNALAFFLPLRLGERLLGRNVDF